VSAVLDQLERDGWLRDERVADVLVSARAQRLGEVRLRQLLAQRGVAAPLADAALARLHERGAGEYERALALWQRRFGAAPSDASTWVRQARFLAGRGFRADVVRRVLGRPPDGIEAERPATEAGAQAVRDAARLRSDDAGSAV
jgi:regulatory protein